ncbi:hypothetical protein FCK90_14975 [Kocuria coralli]|uniref:Uncharacterized protein n=1 Tax=Kocuria coralli TaxID=1461025 RepID=A0A5J5KU67_9MICC|nr:hypothetical protein [Kocuria coralli]KAA9392908.1 hypothetical protein FCK90_14975 [Kocuria coralli]
MNSVLTRRLPLVLAGVLAASIATAAPSAATDQDTGSSGAATSTTSADRLVPPRKPDGPPREGIFPPPDRCLWAPLKGRLLPPPWTCGPDIPPPNLCELRPGHCEIYLPPDPIIPAPPVPVIKSAAWTDAYPDLPMGPGPYNPIPDMRQDLIAV